MRFLAELTETVKYGAGIVMKPSRAIGNIYMGIPVRADSLCRLYRYDGYRHGRLTKLAQLLGVRKGYRTHRSVEDG